MQRVIYRRNDTLGTRRVFSPGDILILLFLFLAAMNIVSKSTYCFFFAFLLCLVTRRKIFLAKKIIPSFLFAFSLLIFWPGAQSSITGMLAAFTYPICFFVGNNLLMKHETRENRERAFTALILCLAAGTWIHMMLNAQMSVGEDIGRNTRDFWTGESRSATGQAGLGILAIGVSVAALFSDLRLRYKLLAAGALTAVMWYNLTLAGRTLLVMLLIVAAVAVCYRMIAKKNGKLSLLLGVIILLAAVMLLYSANTFGVRDLVEESNLYQRLFAEQETEMLESGRFDRKLKYLKYLLEYPVGGGHIRSAVGGYAHDLYLDTYDEAGVFAFLSICVISLQSVTAVVTLLKQKRCAFFTRLLALCVLACLHMEFWIEPILAGFDWMIAMLCAINGAMLCLIEQEKA